jgi:hypothetical protein
MMMNDDYSSPNTNNRKKGKIFWHYEILNSLMNIKTITLNGRFENFVITIFMN